MQNEDDKNKVGYKNPPKHSQWKKGQSGNPNGRPKKNESASTLNEYHDALIRMLSKEAVVKVNGEMATLPYFEIIMNKLISNAMQGDNKSIKLITDLQLKALKSKSQDPKENGGIQIVYLDADDRRLAGAFYYDE